MTSPRLHQRALALAVACASGALAAPGARAEPAGAESRGAAAGANRDVIQGDVIVAAGNVRRGIGYARDRVWPDGVVPMWFDPDLPERTRESIARAADVWNRVAGITLRRVESEAPPAGDHVHVQPGEGCASWVGRRGGGQELWVSPDCTTGSIVHEIGHVLGLEHEHVRPDRDQWIEIRWGNVVEDKRHNFDVAGPGLDTLGAYDYDSIMHYGPDFFSVDGRDTIVPLVGDPRIGQREAPSAGDIDAIARIYGTDLALAGALAGDELVLVATNAGGRGAHDLEIELDADLVLTGATSVEGWSCETPGDRDAATVPPRCRLDRLGAGASSTLALSLRRAGASPNTAPVPLGRIAIALDAVNDDPEPGNDRIELGEPVSGAAVPEPAFEDDASPASAEAAVPADEDAQVSRSPFEPVSLAPGTSAARPGPDKPAAASPVPLTRILATPGEAGVAGRGAGDDGASGPFGWGWGWGGGGGAGTGLLVLAVGTLLRRRWGGTGWRRRRP